jgi:hypothetical protein
VREDGEWTNLGYFRSRNDGGATLPAFRVESRGTYLLRVTVGEGRYRFLKVRGMPNAERGSKTFAFQARHVK